jgi:hypothetical protein
MITTRKSGRAWLSFKANSPPLNPPPTTATVRDIAPP